MLLKEMFEAKSNSVTFMFGRLNPPTIGHKQLLDVAAKQGGDFKIFVSQSQDPKKNPLDYSTKINFIKAMFPEYSGNVVQDAGLNTVVKVAAWLYDQGYREATFVAGSDRLEDMKKLLDQYNGVEGKAHGFYKFDKLNFVSSGEREDGAEGVAGISASGARLAAANNDFEGFAEATGAGKLSKKLYDAVRKGMGIDESVNEIDRRGFLKGLGAAALAGAGMSAQAQEPLPVMATIKFKLSNGEVKVVKKDLGNSYDGRLDDAKKDLENLLDKKGIKIYTIHLDRYEDTDNDRSPTMKTDYVDKKPATDQGSKQDYIDKGPYVAKPSSANYLTQSTDVKEANYGRYWCSTDKKWKTRKGPKQKRSS